MKSNGTLGRSLLTTVSAAALALSMPLAAQAQENATPAWWGSVEGQYTMIDGNAIDLSGFYDGVSLKLSPDDGWTGRLKLGGKIGSDWFAEAGFRYGQSGKDSFSYSYFGDGYGADVDLEYEEEHLVLDLSIGRDVGIGNGGAVRAFGGLRVARFDGDGDGSFYYYGDGYGFADVGTTHRFEGIGPRLGVDALVPVADNVRFDVGVAGALLYGKRKLKIGYSYDGYSYNGYSDSFSDSDKGWVPNVEASAALTYMFSQSASVSAGYRVEFFGNIMPEIDESSLDNGGFGNANRLIHGPFIQLTIMGN